MNGKFDEIELRLLDSAINNLQSWGISSLGDRSIETVTIATGTLSEHAKQKWSALLTQDLFFESDAHPMIRPELEADIRAGVLEYLGSKGITADSVGSLLVSDQTLDLKRLASVFAASRIASTGQREVSFSDYDGSQEDR